MAHVACGIMYNNRNKILLGKRHSNGPYPGIWEFPGGKLEEGESLEECLHREWKEELNLYIIIDNKLTTFTLSNSKGEMTDNFYFIFLG